MTIMDEFKGDKRTKEYKDWKVSQGLGDTIEKVTEATGIKKAVKWVMGEDCGCDDRKEKLNKLFRYKVECLTEKEYKYLKELGTPSVVTNWDMNKVIQIYNRVFHKKRRVSSCGSCMKVVLDDLHKLMAEYEAEN